MNSNTPEEAAVGLCADCQHARRVPGKRTVFYLCGRSLTDPRFRKYPPLPVLRCAGYERTASPGTPPDANPH